MNQYNQVPHLTRDTIWKVTKTQGNITQQESQEVSPFPAGDHSAERNRQDSVIKTSVKETETTKRIHKRSTALERSVKITGGLNMFNLTLIWLNSNMDEDLNRCLVCTKDP